MFPRRCIGTQCCISACYKQATGSLATAPDPPCGAAPPQVAALLQQLQEQEAREPGSKAVVFSSWPCVLGLVSEALAAHGVVHASLAAPSLRLSDRQDAIVRCAAHRLVHTCILPRHHTPGRGAMNAHTVRLRCRKGACAGPRPRVSTLRQSTVLSFAERCNNVTPFTFLYVVSAVRGWYFRKLSQKQ
jgi:hypothetical protein